jgi:uncharacterized membrane protein
MGPLEWLFALLAAVVLAGGLAARRRMQETREGKRPVVTDEVLRRIMEKGEIEEEDPLDEDEIREAEERFWDESRWEDPDEYHP